MEPSFNCFNNYSDNLFSYFKNLGIKYFAHLSHNETEKELLYEHSKLVSDYFLHIVDIQCIEVNFDISIWQLLEKLPIKNTYDWGNLVKEIFYGAIVFHDLGKVNPNFQVEKMKNGLFVFDKRLTIKSNHSLLGSYIYSTIFFEKVESHSLLNDEEKELLFFIILLFGSAIIKHHNPTISFVFEYDEKKLGESYSFLNDVFQIFLQEDFCNSFFIGINQILDDIRNIITEINTYFHLFTITKSLYSLLTASDFYATNEFIAKMKIDDFGCFTELEKDRLIHNFQKIKSYNRDLYVNLNHYLSLSFDELENKNNKNLNILRQKLTAEMIYNLRANSQKKCFYIEAPTGAGKTNLSLAFATELLRIDKSLNKIIYVFPFTTLITQTDKSVKETLDIDNDTVVQLHSKAGFHEKEDGSYGNEKRLYIDNLFVNYPIVLMSHIRFFDILKSNNKEDNYLIHRLYNSIVIIDEIQTYNPEHWDKIVFFLANYAKIFNMRILIMSATLPKIDALHNEIKGSFISLIPNRDKYFTNSNFSGRVTFDFSLLKMAKPTNENKEQYLSELADFLLNKANHYALTNDGNIKVLIEFITKKTASAFFKIVLEKAQKFNYTTLLLSGDILEFRRNEIITQIKENKFSKVIVVSTQVVEAGVDIDMDLGFKDRSLIDSDEQLAGRINRNAAKNNCIVYFFDCDKTSTIYGSDTRYKIQQSDKYIFDDYEDILRNKLFHSLYEKVFEKTRKSIGSNLYSEGYYYQYFMDLDFFKLHHEFQLIENDNSQSLFIPISIPIKYFNNHEFLKIINVLSENEQEVDGEKVFRYYEVLIKGRFEDFTVREIEYKKLGSIMAQFCISVYKKQMDVIIDMFDIEKSKYGYKYLSNWKLCYSPQYGFDSDKIDTSVIL